MSSASVAAALALSYTYIGAGEETRTLDLNLGKVPLYQLSYARMVREEGFTPTSTA